MPDCSAVTIRAYPQRDHEALRKEFEDFEGPESEFRRWDWTSVATEVNRDQHGSPESVEWSDYDCPWGMTTPEEAGVFERLTAYNIAWEAFDYGHYTWTGEYWAWKPGMDEPYSTQCDTDGNPLVGLNLLKTILTDVAEGDTTMEVALMSLDELIPPDIP